MSAFNCFLTSDAAHVFTDAANYESENLKVVAFASKVSLLPQYNAVIGFTGPYHNLPLLSTFISGLQYDNFDHLAAEFVSVIKRAVAKTNDIFPNGAAMWGEYTFGLAGWSPKQSAPAFFSVKNDGANGQEVAVPATKYYNPDAAVEGFDDSITRHKFDPDRPGESGLAIMQAQRLTRFSPLGNVGVKHNTYHAIGGWCQHTVISRDGISVKVLEHWPDRIGSTVMPVLPRTGSMIGGTFGGR
jgi:hypothetical protein